MSIRYLTCNESLSRISQVKLICDQNCKDGKITKPHSAPRNLETTNKFVLDILEYKRTASITCFVQKVSTVPFFQV